MPFLKRLTHLNSGLTSKVNNTMTECAPASSTASNEQNSKNETDLSFTISAPGKVILYGEHSAVYDKSTIAASLNLRTQLTFVEIESLNSTEIHLETLNLTKCYGIDIIKNDLLKKPLPLLARKSNYNWKQWDLIKHDDLLSEVQEFINNNNEGHVFDTHQYISLCSLFYIFAGILRSVNITIKPFNMKVKTDLTIGAGAGSSASYLVAAAAAFIHYLRIKSSQLNLDNISKDGYKPCKQSMNLKTFDAAELELISKWAYCAEKIVHGSPSGIDNTICTYGSMVEFRKSGGIKFLPPCEISLLLVNTKVSRNTKHLVKQAASLRDRHKPVVDSLLNTMHEISVSALDTLMKLSRFADDWQDSIEVCNLYGKLGELMDINQHLLRALGVSHPTLDEICAILKASNLVGKLTGAGGGGYAISLVPPNFSKEKIEDVVKKLRVRGYEVVLTKLGGIGVSLDS